MQKRDRVAVAFFGDGAVEGGAFHESLNFASLWKLPVLFVCENNFYATHSHQSARQPADNIHERASGYLVPGVRVDGTDVLAVYEAARRGVERARDGAGPTLLEVRLYRWKEHVGPNFDFAMGYRTKEELESWMARCPIRLFGGRLTEAGLCAQADLDRFATAVDAEIAEAVRYGQTSQQPTLAEMVEDVY